MKKHQFKDMISRSLAKTVTYRVLIVIMDFTVAYILTHQIDAAIGFTILRNTYTTIGYYIHERAWDKIIWGKTTNNP